MRKTLLTLTALLGLAGAGSAATAAPVGLRLETNPAATMVQHVQYYESGREEWRRREWIRRRRWEQRERWHRWHRRDEFRHGW